MLSDDPEGFDYGPPETWVMVPIEDILDRWSSVDAEFSPCPECGSSDTGEMNYETDNMMYCRGCYVDYHLDFEMIFQSKREDAHYPFVLNSLKEYGWAMPLHMSATVPNRVTDGHHRLAAAVELGLTHVPFYAVDDCRGDGHGGATPKGAGVQNAEYLASYNGSIPLSGEVVKDDQLAIF